MHRIHTTTLALAMLAGLGLPALAQNPAATGGKDATQVVPKKEDLPARPSVPAMDANVQRQHDRDSGVKPQGATAQRGGQVAAGGVRDWDAIDTNNDNLIQPEEMEAALKEVGPQAAKK